MICLLLSRTNDHGTINPIDRFFRKHFCGRVQKALNISKRRADLYATCLFEIVMILSDQQLITGIAILAAAVKELHEGKISVYHFTIVTDLSWFSSNTHLLSLLVVRSFSQSFKPGANKNGKAPISTTSFRYAVPAFLRIVLMIVMAVLLLYCSWVSGYGQWYDSFGCPAHCIVSAKKTGRAKNWMIVNFVLILWAYPQQMFLLMPKFRHYWMTSLRNRIVPDKAIYVSAEKWWNSRVIHRHMLEVLRRTFLCVWYLLSSETEAILELTAWFALGIYWTITDRISGHNVMESAEKEQENTLGFGQMVPLFLLALPFMQAIESYYGKTISSIICSRCS